MKKDIRNIVILAVCALLAAGFTLAAARTGIARAVLVFQNEDAVNELNVEMSSLEVSIIENGSLKSGNTLFESLKSQNVDPGYTYEESVSARNTGSISEYVRMIVRKYWTDADGKRVDLNPAYIELQVNDSDWFEDPYERSTEQSVYYFRNVLNTSGESSSLITGLRISPDLYNDSRNFTFTDTNGDKIFTLDFDYDEITFNVEIEVQAVQAENAASAIPSAWGTQRITLDGTSLVLSR